MRMIRFLVFLTLSFFSASCSAEDSLAQWVKEYDKPEVQQKILNLIFSGQVGPLSNAIVDKKNGTSFFPQGGDWVRLGGNFVWSAPPEVKKPYLVVTCMMYQAIDREPRSATSYLFRDAVEKPRTLTAGYATHEQIHLVKLPKLDKSFLVIEDSVASPQGAMRQWSAFLLEVPASGLSDNPRNVWMSPMASRNFQFCFDELGGKKEQLVFRTARGSGGDVEYSVYRWNGSRFEPDGLVFESKLKALPDSVWKYGTKG